MILPRIAPAMLPPPPPVAARAFTASVARTAVASLYKELVLYPKPGLVSLVDNGSHTDMNAATFMRSLFSLRHYFARICQAGFDDAPFTTLRKLGIDAETRMLRATGGINTHRGAIFSLGLLCAAAGRAHAQRVALKPSALRAVLLIRWGDELAEHSCPEGGASNGLTVAANHAVSGAREEGALGFPSVFEVGLPALQKSLARNRTMQLAQVDALFALMAHVSDTNVYHRGGADGARTVRQHARDFIDMGGTAHPQWRNRALASHRVFVERRLSPGGAADLLAASCLVHALTT